MAADKIGVKFTFEKKKTEPKFKIGDRVIVTKNSIGAPKGSVFTINYVQDANGHYSYNDLHGEDPAYKPVVSFMHVIPEECLALFQEGKSMHKGKILIMVDEKDPDKIIARDLLTNKTAEAKRNPKDDWDFNKGAKLALERLIPEKPKGWTGKVVCIQSGPRLFGMFVKGKTYCVENGRIYHEGGLSWLRFDDSDLFMSADEVDSYFNKISEGDTRFIEYKGGSEE